MDTGTSESGEEASIGGKVVVPEFVAHFFQHASGVPILEDA